MNADWNAFYFNRAFELHECPVFGADKKPATVSCSARFTPTDHPGVTAATARCVVFPHMSAGFTMGRIASHHAREGLAAKSQVAKKTVAVKWSQTELTDENRSLSGMIVV